MHQAVQSCSGVDRSWVDVSLVSLRKSWLKRASVGVYISHKWDLHVGCCLQLILGERSFIGGIQLGRHWRHLRHQINSMLQSGGYCKRGRGEIGAKMRKSGLYAGIAVVCLPKAQPVMAGLSAAPSQPGLASPDRSAFDCCSQPCSRSPWNRLGPTRHSPVVFEQPAPRLNAELSCVILR